MNASLRLPIYHTDSRPFAVWPQAGYMNQDVASQLGQAAVHFEHGEHKRAREIYAEVIKTCPTCPASVRVALGMCLYKLGHIDAAKQAMERALQMEVRTEGVGGIGICLSGR